MRFNDWLGTLVYVAVAAAAVGGAGVLTDTLGTATTATLAVGVPPLWWP
jgi:hypothetical protein